MYEVVRVVYESQWTCSYASNVWQNKQKIVYYCKSSKLVENIGPESKATYMASVSNI